MKYKSDIITFSLNDRGIVVLKVKKLFSWQGHFENFQPEFDGTALQRKCPFVTESAIAFFQNSLEQLAELLEYDEDRIFDELDFLEIYARSILSVEGC